MTAALVAALATGVGAATPPPSLSQIVEVVDIACLAVAPDGKTVVFRQAQSSLERNAKELSWWSVDVEGGAPAQRIADGGRAIWNYGGVMASEAPQWSNDGTSLYFRALIDDQIQVWRAGPGLDARAVTRGDGDVRSFGLSPDGRTLSVRYGPSRAAIVAAEQREREQGVRIDKAIDPAQNLFAAGEVNGRLAAQRLSGPWFKRGGLLADQPDVVEALNLAPGGGESSTLVKTPDDPFGKLKVQRQGDQALVQVTRPSGAVITCTAEPCRMATSAAWRPGRDEVILTLSDTARRQWLVSWRPATSTLRTLIKASGLLDGGVSGEPCVFTSNVAVCVAAAPTAPPKLVRVSLDTGEIRTLAEPNAALAAARRPDVRLLEWRLADGRSFSGWLLSPQGPAQRRPLFVNYYLCEGYLRGGFGDEFPLAALADAGIPALCINKRYQTLEDHDAIIDYQNGLAAILAAVDELDREGLVDRKHVGMGGFSFGSEVTTWVAMNSDLLAAASIASTQIEPAYYWLNGVAGRGNHDVLRRNWKLGAPEETPARWREVSPALNVDRIRAPLLMQMPEQEYRLTFELFARLSNSTTPVDLYVFPDEPHIKTQPRHRLAVYTRNLDWFRFWLQGEVDPDPAKAEQNAHWQAMAARQAQVAGSTPGSSQP